MKVKVHTIISLTREDQERDVAALHGDELKNFIKELVRLAQERRYNIGLMKIIDNPSVDDKQKRNLVHKLLKQFPDVPSIALALDRKFADQKERMLAIIDDINCQRLPERRYHELLHENLREGGEFEGDPIITRTFLAFALGKIKDKEHFLRAFKSAFGAHQFEMYCNTQNFLETNTRVTLSELYLGNYGGLNLEERQSLTKNESSLLGNNLKVCESVNVNKVNAHNTSSNKSADESHVAAFQSMLAAEGLGVVVCLKSNSKIQIIKRGRLDEFVAGKIKSLKVTLDTLAEMDDVTLFEKYVCNTLEDSSKRMRYKDNNLRNKRVLAGFRFQLYAAQRYVNDMLTHKCESIEHPYETNVATENGLTMEEMLATAYWATTDQLNLRNEHVTLEGNLIQLVKQLHDIRRGYDIDNGTDQPDASPPVFPENPAVDQNRCLGGSVNSLPWGLASVHCQYNPRHIPRASLVRELKTIYMNLITKEDIAEFQEPDNKEALRIWNLSGEITGQMADKLRARFKEKHELEFIDSYKGYIDDKLFQEVLNNGLKDIPVPGQLKFPMEQMTPKEIYDAIVENKLPLLHLDPDKGCESTLNYLQAIEANKDLITFIFKTAKLEKKPMTNLRVMFFLSRSNLSPEKKNWEVLKVKENSITIGDVGTLINNEFIALSKVKEDDLVTCSITNQYINLFAIYACKIGFAPEELTRKYGPKGQTPTHFAIVWNRGDLVKNIFAAVNNEPDAINNMLEAHDNQGNNALHLITRLSNADLVLGHARNSPALLRKLLDENNLLGQTPMLNAVFNKRPDIALVMLEIIKIDKVWLQNQLAVKNVKNKDTVLIVAVIYGYADLIEAILAAIVDDPDLLECQLDMQNGEGDNAFTIAVSEGNSHAVQAMLGATGKYPALLRRQLEAEDPEGYTKLQSSVKSSSSTAVKVLLTAVSEQGLLGKQLIMDDKNQSTLLNLAISSSSPNDEIDVEKLAIIIAILDAVKDNPALLLQQLTTPNAEGNTPLHIAICHGHINLVKAIINAAKSSPGILKVILELTLDGAAAIHIAAFRTNFNSENLRIIYSDILKVILESIKDDPALLQSQLEKLDAEGRTPLITAISECNAQAAAEILEVAKVYPKLLQNQLETRYDKRYTPVQLAFLNRDIAVMTVIFSAASEQGILEGQLTGFNHEGNTLAHWAISEKQPEILEVILKYAKTTPGLLPVQLAAENAKKETLLQVAVYNGNGVAVKTIRDAAPEIFLSQLDRVCRRGKTLLQIALAEGSIDVAEVVFMSIKDNQSIVRDLIETIDFYGNSFLRTISNPDVLRMVLDHTRNFTDLIKEQLESTDIFGQTLLHKVVDIGDIVTLNKILEVANDSPGSLQTQLATRDIKGNTVLGIAVMKGDRDAVNAIVEFVKEFAPDFMDSLLNIPGANGQTLYDKANALSNKEIAALLLINGAKSASRPTLSSPTGSPVKRARQDEGTSCTAAFQDCTILSVPLFTCDEGVRVPQVTTSSPVKRPRDEAPSYDTRALSGIDLSLKPSFGVDYLSSASLPTLSDMQEGAQVSHVNTSPTKKFCREGLDVRGSDGKGVHR